MTDEPLEPLDPSPPPGPEPRSPDRTEGPRSGVAPAPSPGPRRLQRSRDDRVVAGVCGGTGEYFGIDAALVRIGFVLLVFAGGLGILAYILGWILFPEEPLEAARATSPTADTADDSRPGSGALVVGLVFVALGALFLFDVEWSDFLSWEYIWPISLIAVGIAVVLRARR